nr:SHOCT domain-containing protein [uncultured Arsenicibacter sp.]
MKNQRFPLRAGRSLLAALFISGVSMAIAQTPTPKPVTADDLRKGPVLPSHLHWGYSPKAAPGWRIQKGDTLSLGEGSMPNHSFTFIYVNHSWPRVYMPTNYINGRAVVKELVQTGTKEQGYTMGAILSVGRSKKYFIELENAVNAGELMPPPQIRGTVITSLKPFSIADEIRKLKTLADEGVLTQAEYETAKQKLLTN